jgi:hypothetical protein
MKEYADIGGRVFMSHWHNIWISGAYTDTGNQKPAVWSNLTTGPVVSWTDGQNFSTLTDVIDEQSNPKGTSFANWMKVVEPGNPRGEIPVNNGRITSSGVQNGTELWTYVKGTNNPRTPQNFQFTTPFESAADQRCGKVVYSDMHVSGNGGNENSTYPNSCGATLTMSAQEKALAFMLFDLASCVGVLL